MQGEKFGYFEESRSVDGDNKLRKQAEGLYLFYPLGRSDIRILYIRSVLERCGRT